MCVFVLTLTLPVFVGKAIADQASASEMEDMKSDNVDSEATNFSKSVDVSSWSDVSEVTPKKTRVSTGCGTSSNQTSTMTTSKEGKSECVNQKVEGAQKVENEKKLVSTSTGTSPPPQNISTQVSSLQKDLYKSKQFFKFIQSHLNH